MQYSIEVIEVDNAKITIGYDGFAENPREWDNLGIMLYARDNRGRILGDKEVSVKEILEIAKREDIICLPVYAYLHSGIALNTFGFSCPWDSGQVGIIYVEKSKVREKFNCKRITKKIRERVEKALMQEVETFGLYLNGSVYAYEVSDDYGRLIESCHGFYDFDYCKQCALDVVSSSEVERG